MLSVLDSSPYLGNIAVFSNIRKRKGNGLKIKTLFSFRHSKNREPIYRLIPICGGINHSPSYFLGVALLVTNIEKTSELEKTSEKRSMSQHDLTVLSKNRARRTLGKVVGNHEVGPKRNETHNTSSIKLAEKMNADVNVARRFPANRIGRHGDAHQVVLIDISRCIVFLGESRSVDTTTGGTTTAAQICLNDAVSCTVETGTRLTTSLMG